jgi:hypothetical protein
MANNAMKRKDLKRVGFWYRVIKTRVTARVKAESADQRQPNGALDETQKCNRSKGSASFYDIGGMKRKGQWTGHHDAGRNMYTHKE